MYFIFIFLLFILFYFILFNLYFIFIFYYLFYFIYLFTLFIYLFIYTFIFFFKFKCIKIFYGVSKKFYKPLKINGVLKICILKIGEIIFILMYKVDKILIDNGHKIQ